MSLNLYLLRHGQTDSSRENLFCGSGSDIPLTEAGKEMARCFAEAYSSKSWRAVYSSPLTRALTTAQPLCQKIGIKPEVRTGLQEIGYGKWEGQSVATITRDFHDDYIRWTADPAWYAPTGGEPAIGIARRSLEVVEEIKQRFDSGNVLIISHKATIRITICNLLGIDVGRFRYRFGCPVCSISQIEFTQQGPLLHLLADRSHLTAELRALPGT